MGASESMEAIEDEEHDGFYKEEDVNDQGDYETIKLLRKDMTNILEHGFEMTPSVSSLSPQLSSFDTPRIDQAIKDLNGPYGTSNMTRNFSFESLNDDRTTEIYVICHGECHMKLNPDLVSGRCPEAALTPNGKRQSRALAVFLKSQGVRFNAIYTSPLDRARATAIPVYQEMNFPEHMIQTSDALQDMSQGIWEGCHHSDVYTPSVVSMMDRLQPDFCAPSGETLRQVEFRMMEFLNSTVTCMPENLKCDFPPLDSVPTLPKLDLSTRPRLGGPKKKSSKSRLQMVHASIDHEADDEMTPREPSKHREPKVFPEPIMEKNCSNNNNHSNNNNSHLLTDWSCCIGLFSHSIPIKCLVTGILGCSPTMTNKICIEDSSITVLQYSQKLGWQIKRVNDTCHLRLM